MMISITGKEVEVLYWAEKFAHLEAECRKASLYGGFRPDREMCKASVLLNGIALGGCR